MHFKRSQKEFIPNVEHTPHKETSKEKVTAFINNY